LATGQIDLKRSACKHLYIFINLYQTIPLFSVSLDGPSQRGTTRSLIRTTTNFSAAATRSRAKVGQSAYHQRIEKPSAAQKSLIEGTSSIHGLGSVNAVLRSSNIREF